MKSSTKKSFKFSGNIKTETFLLGILAVLFIILSLINRTFLTGGNISNLVRQTSINGIVAIGMTFVIISAGIDLSVGSVVGLSGIIVAMLIKSGMPITISIIISLVLSTAVGLVNGVLVYDLHSLQH